MYNICRRLTNVSNLPSRSQPHLQPFGLEQIIHTPVSDFHIFPRLPKELRQKIWRHSMLRQRIIQVRLKDQALGVGPTAEASETSNFEFTRNGERFWAIVDGYQALSKLLRVNEESRAAALLFYRVHFPCKFRVIRDGKEITKPGTFYFNPEFDFLHINPEWSAKNTLFDFFYHLKNTYDPSHIGLRNLMVSGNTITANDLQLIEPSDIEPGARAAFTRILEGLYEVFFFSTTRAGRQILGIHSAVVTHEIIYNRSFPILANVPTFERFRRHPRPIAEDLKHIYTGMADRRGDIRLWRQLLKKWSISPVAEPEYRWYIAFEPEEADEVFDRESAKKFMQKEDDEWNGVERPKQFNIPGYKFPIGSESEQYKNEDLEKAVKPAFGFWLFPIEVLGPMQEEGVSEEEGFRPRRDNQPVLWDFSDHWPGLGLLSLPEGVGN